MGVLHFSGKEFPIQGDMVFCDEAVQMLIKEGVIPPNQPGECWTFLHRGGVILFIDTRKPQTLSLFSRNVKDFRLRDDDGRPLWGKQATDGCWIPLGRYDCNQHFIKNGIISL